MQTTELFGGISILLCGDFKKLPPVADTCLWLTELDGMFQPRSDEVRDGLIAFKSFKTVVVLTEIVRQESPDQVAFLECLSKFRLGQVTKEEYNLLLARNTFKHCARWRMRLMKPKNCPIKISKRKWKKINFYFVSISNILREKLRYTYVTMFNYVYQWILGII
jgi:hypothetical protein